MTTAPEHFRPRDIATADRNECRDRILSRDPNLSLADAGVLLADEGYRIPTTVDVDGWYRGDNGHANKCPRDGSTKCGAGICRAIRAGLLPDHRPTEFGERVRFTCGGCGQRRDFATSAPDTRDGWRMVAERAHLVARSIIGATPGWGVRTYHDAVTVYRCRACHSTHADGTVILPPRG